MRWRAKSASARPGIAGEWITGWGWTKAVAGGYPTNEKLDAAAPVNPVWLGIARIRGLANARALEIAGSDRHSDPRKGNSQDPKTGRPTGILKDAAQELLTRHIPPHRLPHGTAFTLATEECLKYGLTTVHDANVSGPMLATLRSLRRNGSSKTGSMSCWTRQTGTRGIMPAARPEIDPQHWLTIRCIKIFADGALGSRAQHCSNHTRMLRKRADS